MKRTVVLGMLLLLFVSFCLGMTATPVKAEKICTLECLNGHLEVCCWEVDGDQVWVCHIKGAC